MIPKKIHFCWFSKDPFPPKIKRCMDSWNKQLGDCEFIHWDLNKALQAKIPWVDEALQQKNYAFAADAIRLYALYSEGGIYLDSDVEVIKPFESLLSRPYFFCYENGSRRIEGAVMGCEAGNQAIKKALDFYTHNHYIYAENKVDNLVLPYILEQAFSNFPDIEILPESYFSPKNYIDGTIKLKAETFCIHHFESSWRPESLQNHIKLRQKIYRIFPKPIAAVIVKFLALQVNLKTLGFKETLQKIIAKG